MNTRIDIAALLEPITPDSPCGDDMEYTPAFAALQMAAAGKPEQQVGELIKPAAAPDWQQVVEQSLGLLSRTHDLRVACQLTQALLHVDGLQGLAAGLALVRGYVQASWDDLYPRLDAEDAFDPAIRVNALALLCNVGAIVNPLRSLPLVTASAAGAISLRAMARATGAEATPAGDTGTPAIAEIDAAFEAMDLAGLQSLLAAAQAARQEAVAIESHVVTRVGAARSLDFGPVTQALQAVESVVLLWLARRSQAQTPAAGAEDDFDFASLLDSVPTQQPVPAEVALMRAPSSEPACLSLRSRDEVMQALDEMVLYFAQNEPGHPVPILLERARRWIAMGYMALLQDLAPEAAEQAQKLRGAT